ncbi:MAG: hypothetical protein EOM37_04710 [Proteobacteria bacterium]|nr:hypothetical protein [Pseudomonadota bacterium]
MKNLGHKMLKLLIVGAVVFLSSATAGWAAETPAVPDTDEVVLTAFGDELLSQDEMGKDRGAAAINTLSSSQSLSSATTGNSLNVGGNLSNGAINVGENFGGFGSYVMNTGNNSTVNSAVSFNVQVLPSP